MMEVSSVFLWIVLRYTGSVYKSVIQSKETRKKLPSCFFFFYFKVLKFISNFRGNHD